MFKNPMNQFEELSYNGLTKILKSLFKNKSSLAEKMPELTRNLRAEEWQSDILNIFEMGKHGSLFLVNECVKAYVSKAVVDDMRGFRFLVCGPDILVFFGEEDSRSLLTVKNLRNKSEKEWVVHLLSSGIHTVHRIPCKELE